MTHQQSSTETKQKALKSKFQEAFEAFAPTLSSAEIANEISKLINTYKEELQGKDTIRFIHSCIDLTTLAATDHTDSVYHLVSRVNELDAKDPSIPPVASICTYPNFVATVRQFLTAEEVKVCAVSGGFPASQTFQEVKVAETALAIKDGADEIDIVLHVGNFLAGDYDACSYRNRRATRSNQGCHPQSNHRERCSQKPREHTTRQHTITLLRCRLHQNLHRKRVPRCQPRSRLRYGHRAKAIPAKVWRATRT